MWLVIHNFKNISPPFCNVINFREARISYLSMPSDIRMQDKHENISENLCHVMRENRIKICIALAVSLTEQSLVAKPATRQ
jgi:hypothetical protein